MVCSRVRGLVCWMYLLLTWLTPPAPPPTPGPAGLRVICGTTDMLASSGTGGKGKGRGWEMFPVPAEVICIPLNSRRPSLTGERKSWLILSNLTEPESESVFWDLKRSDGASLVAQWLRVCLPMQGTWVRALVWEDPTCRGAAGPVSHNYWACASGACAPQQERPRQWKARAPRWRVDPARRN